MIFEMQQLNNISLQKLAKKKSGAIGSCRWQYVDNAGFWHI